MKITCPDCAKEIPLADANVSTDVALCRACEKTFSFAELTEYSKRPVCDITTPPDGTWVRVTGDNFEIGTSMRSFLAYIFVFAAVFGLIFSYNFFWEIPSNIMGHDLFFLPGLLLFILFNSPSIALALVHTYGKLIIRGDNERGSISMGVGPLCYTRRFRWSEIKRIHMVRRVSGENEQPFPAIEIEREGKPIRFGSILTAPRRNFLLAMLKRIHSAKK